jgi:acyl-coenzyme A thioesterase PaaI-like protein
MQKLQNSRHCFVCGVENPSGLRMKFYQSAPGEVEAHYTASEVFQGYPGVVHGGVIASMLDEVTGRALMDPPGSPTRFMVTAQLSIRYRKPVPVGQPLRLVGHAGERRGRVAKARGEIFGPDGSLLVEADAVLVDIPPDGLKEMDHAALGWKVYPDEEELT